MYDFSDLTDTELRDLLAIQRQDYANLLREQNSSALELNSLLTSIHEMQNYILTRNSLFPTVPLANI